ncbi:MAG: N-acetylmuramoyl-L-alanine amidase [Chloroherpetonaceae bacterium]|nr:N-acetylmuramoyl-L-alanine amidase [Chthonomonadaceae bacterium]MDW8207491.1 N-acetylmuramoyl-L-alanine amidase [Chloroherpetonaceae bacterium]
MKRVPRKPLLPIFMMLVMLASMGTHARGLEGLTPVRLRFAGKEVALKSPALASDQEVYVPLETIKALGGELKAGRRNDVLLVRFRAVTREAEIAPARINGNLMFALSDLARLLDAVVERPPALDASGKPVEGRPGDTVYLLVKVLSAWFENGALRILTNYPVPFRVRTLTEGSPVRGYVDCLGATFAEQFVLRPLPEGEKQALRLRHGRNTIEVARVVVELAEGYALRAVDRMDNVATQINARLASGPGDAAEPGQKERASVAQAVPSDQALGDVQTNTPPMEGEKNPAAGTSVKKDPSANPAGNVPPVPAEVRRVTFLPESDQLARLEILTSRKVRPYVRYERGTTLLVVDIPDALPRLPEGEEVSRKLSHPLINGLHIATSQKNPPVTRVTLDLNRVVGFTPTLLNNGITLELRVPRNATGSLKGKLIVVDPGHGGRATGAVSNGVQEKHICLAIGLKLRDALEACGVNVIMTRDSDRDVGLYDRTKLANDNGADLFISIHNDSNGRPNSVSGTSVYYHMGDASSRALAACVVQAIHAVSGLPSRGALSDGILYANGLAVLRTSKMPAVLCEIAYINHDRDRALLVNPAFQKKVALAIVRGIRNYIEGRPQDDRPAEVERVEASPLEEPEPGEDP